MSAFPLVFSIPMFIVALFFIQKPSLDTIFYGYFIVSLPVNAAMFLIYMAAIRISPLSLTLPYMAFTPAFMIATGYIFLGEIPDRWGLIGIVITCVGSYVLNLNANQRSIFEPFTVIFREKGSWFMLIAAFLASLGAVFGKKAMLHSSPMFFSMSFFVIFSFMISIILILSGKISILNFRKHFLTGIISGLLLFAHIVFHGLAITLTKAAYMISVKRLSVLFGIIYGGVIFQEKNIIFRLCGAMFMLSGAALITLMGK